MVLFASIAGGAVDSLTMIVNNTNAVGGVPTNVPLGAFGYDSTNNRIYVAGANGADQQIRRIDNVDGAQTVTTLIYATAWQMFTKAGDPNNGGGVPGPTGMLLNPQTVGALGPNGNIWFMDGSPVVTVSNVPHPELTQRIYRYNLQQDTNGDARDEMTSLLTLGQYRTAASTTANTTGASRQYAWSGDGQSLYFVDSAPSFGGLWKMPAAGGTVQHLLTSTTLNDLNAEPAVTSSGGVDTIYFAGSSVSSGGRIDKVTYDGTTVSARTTAVSQATLNNFFELSSGSITVGSMTSDPGGNLYFNDFGSLRTGIYRLDPQGRLIKVVSYAERQSAFQVGAASISVLTQRMQPRTITYSGANGSFPLTQILYTESSPYNFIAGANVFKPGDFNRDNSVNNSDMALFQQALTPKGVQASTANLKFDLNGNGEVSWKDVKILQQFCLFPDADANMDGRVDVADLWAVAKDWQTSGQTWVGGDFTGDGLVNLTDLQMLANNWGDGINSQTYSAALTEVGLAIVPEPACLTLFGTIVMLYARRRW